MIHRIIHFCLAPPSGFYGKDTVNVVGGGQRAIEDLKAGDRIWSINRDGTSLFEDEVMLMSDNGPNEISESTSLHGYKLDLIRSNYF